MIPIDEQIKHQQNTVKIIEDFDDKESLPKEQAILASLERLKAIESVQVPEQPREGGVGVFSEFIVSKQTQEYIDTLLDLLKRERTVELHSNSVFVWAERAEAAEAKLAEQAGVKK